MNKVSFLFKSIKHNTLKCCKPSIDSPLFNDINSFGVDGDDIDGIKCTH